jgi:hypothetical protein
MHTSIILAGISMAIMSYSDEKDETAIYGLMLLPVAIVFIVYAMYQCTYHIESFRTSPAIQERSSSHEPRFFQMLSETTCC